MLDRYYNDIWIQRRKVYSEECHINKIFRLHRCMTNGSIHPPILTVMVPVGGIVHLSLDHLDGCG